MASSEHPETPPATTGIQTPSGIQTPAETPPVALPPLPQKPAIAPTAFLRLRSGLDAPLVFATLLFAFLVASFPAVNSDFFRHAAIGRLLIHNEYRFGVDPFVYTAGDTYFVNHSWLFDLLIYGLYQIPSVQGVDAVVVFKAILTVLLAVVLLCAGRRAEQSLWIPVVCTALALLVVSPRLLLQSTCLSFLFLGLTVWLLAAVERGERRMGWLLPPLFALWVNCDAWFFLGPLALALYLLGGLIPTGQLAVPARDAAAGWWMLAVGVAACLVNPHHYHAFTLPPEFGLSAAGGLIERDPYFFYYFLSPLGKDYYRANVALSAAGLAYWPLLALGLTSFVFLFLSGQVPGRRLLLWSGFALMSLYNMRAIPFFAIVAGPIASLNWLDFAVQRLGAGPRLSRGWRSWSLGGRLLTGLLFLVLLIAAVPGWLQRSQPTFRRIGWNVQTDPSLEAMALTIRDWRTAGLLPEQPHWFNMNPEIANYLAWYAPGERVFLDQNLPECRETAQDYLDIRKGLEQMLPDSMPDEGDSVALKTDWRKILREKQVRYWIFDNSSQGKAAGVARGYLFSQPDEWVLCHLHGRVAVFAWRDPQQPAPDPSTGLQLDLRHAAFGSKAEPAPPRGSQPAPPREWWQMCWDAWRQPNPPPSSDREVISLYDTRFQTAEIQQHNDKFSRIWQRGVAASVVAGSLPHGPIPSGLLAWSWSCTYHDLFPPQAEHQPSRQPYKADESAMQARYYYVNSRFIEPPSLYLALRAARRALAGDPEDGLTYFRLAQIYQRLRELPQERNLQGPALQVPTLRRTQIAGALHNYLLLQPDGNFAWQAHMALYSMFEPRPGQPGYIDAAVYHLRQALHKREAAGPLPGESHTKFKQALDQMNAGLTRLDGELESRLNRYEVNAAAKTGLEKVKVALEMGLAETALTALGETDAEEAKTSAGVAIVKQVTDVVLDLGRLDKARELLPDLEGGPVMLEDVGRYVRLAAARGDYAEADRILDEAVQHPPARGDFTFATAQAIARVLLAEAQTATNTPRAPFLSPMLPSHFWVRRLRMDAIFTGLLVVRQRAEWSWTRGWLALEAGRCGEARKHFQTARDLTVPITAWAPEVDRLVAWVIPQQEMSRWQQQEMPRWQQLGYSHAILHDLSAYYLTWLEEK
jgi:tetratricopeptide (TPR) repeat protein